MKFGNQLSDMKGGMKYQITVASNRFPEKYGAILDTRPCQNGYLKDRSITMDMFGMNYEMANTE